LADGYDAMTDFSSRTIHAEHFVVRLRKVYPKVAGRVADVGTGSGAYALALARQGISSVGLDPSEQMVCNARANALRMDVHNAQFARMGMADLGLVSVPPFNAVLCMGNTVPHMLADEELDHGLAATRRSLSEGGILVLQLLNYERILAEQERIVSIDSDRNEGFVRFYDFLPDGMVRFNLLRFSSEAGDHKLKSVLLRPYVKDELVGFLQRAGFTDIEAFGDLDLAPFDPAQSDTLLLVAVRQGD
jgi:SAM-dependent methyltransferase